MVMFSSKAFIFAVLTVNVSAGPIPGEEAHRHSGQGVQKRSVTMDTGKIAKRYARKVPDCPPGEYLVVNHCEKPY